MCFYAHGIQPPSSNAWANSFLSKGKSSTSSCLPSFPRNPAPQLLFYSTASPPFSSVLCLPWTSHPATPDTAPGPEGQSPRSQSPRPVMLPTLPPCLCLCRSHLTVLRAVNPAPFATPALPFPSCPLPPWVLHLQRALSSSARQVALTGQKHDSKPVSHRFQSVSNAQCLPSLQITLFIR